MIEVFLSPRASTSAECLRPYFNFGSVSAQGGLSGRLGVKIQPVIYLAKTGKPLRH